MHFSFHFYFADLKMPGHNNNNDSSTIESLHKIIKLNEFIN